MWHYGLDQIRGRRGPTNRLSRARYRKTIGIQPARGHRVGQSRVSVLAEYGQSMSPSWKILPDGVLTCHVVGKHRLTTSHLHTPSTASRESSRLPVLPTPIKSWSINFARRVPGPCLHACLSWKMPSRLPMRPPSPASVCSSWPFPRLLRIQGSRPSTI